MELEETVDRLIHTQHQHMAQCWRDVDHAGSEPVQQYVPEVVVTGGDADRP